MDNYNISLPSATDLLKRRSSLFKPTFEENEILKKCVSNFLKTHQNKDAPITWQRLSQGYRIIDFETDRVEETINFLKTHYFCSYQSCASSALYIDFYTIETYQQFILNVISNQNSFFAVEEGTGKLIGVALASINDALDDSAEEEVGAKHKTDIFDVLKYERVLLHEANICNYYNIDKYYCIHAICVMPEAYNKGIGSALVRACLSKASKIGCSVCVGIFPAGPSQTIAKRFNFENLANLPWVNIKSLKIGHRHSYTSHSVVENSFVSCMGILMSVDDDNVAAEKSSLDLDV